MDRSARWLRWSAMIERRVRAGEYTQDEADDLWIWLHTHMVERFGPVRS